MIQDRVILGTVLFSQPLHVIRQQVQGLRKDVFEVHDRIVIEQDVEDQYPYIDAPGQKLIEIQKIVNRLDLSNQFILIRTPNQEIWSEIQELTAHYSHDKTFFDFEIVPGRYQRKPLKRENTACSLLWSHLYVGPDANVHPCCMADHRWPLGNLNDDSIEDIRNSEKSQEIRRWMMQGYQTRSCAVCYDKEEQGLRSHRRPTVADTAMADPVDHVDVRASNICNFKCRMCSEYFSSAIQQETIELYGRNPVLGFEPVIMMSDPRSNKQSISDKILPYLDHDLIRVNFAGGEPLLSDYHYAMLDRLIEIKHHDLQIRYTTNLSTLRFKSHSVLAYWKQFSDVEVNASIDAAGPVAEYMRHGTRWHEIETNIQHIKSGVPHVRLRITSAVSFPTVENLIDLQKRWISQGLFLHSDFSINAVISPVFLDLGVLPRHHKQRLTSKIQDHMDFLGECDLARAWSDMLQYMDTNELQHALPDFRSRFITLDQHRKESFVDVFPQFRDLYDLNDNLQLT